MRSLVPFTEEDLCDIRRIAEEVAPVESVEVIEEGFCVVHFVDGQTQSWRNFGFCMEESLEGATYMKGL
jgi:hypothetical protein